MWDTAHDEANDQSRGSKAKCFVAMPGFLVAPSTRTRGSKPDAARRAPSEQWGVSLNPTGDATEA